MVEVAVVHLRLLDAASLVVVPLRVVNRLFDDGPFSSLSSPLDHGLIDQHRLLLFATSSLLPRARQELQGKPVVKH